MLGIRAVSVRSHRLFKPPACVWLGCEMSNSLLYLASGMVKFCDKQSTSTDTLLGGAVSSEKGQRTVPPLHRLRCGSERSPPSLDPRGQFAKSGVTAENFPDPFHAGFYRRFCTSECLRPVAEYVVGLPQVDTVGVRVCPKTQTPDAAIADGRSNK